LGPSNLDCQQDSSAFFVANLKRTKVLCFSFKNKVGKKVNDTVLAGEMQTTAQGVNLRRLSMHRQKATKNNKKRKTCRKQGQNKKVAPQYTPYKLCLYHNLALHAFFWSLLKKLSVSCEPN
jgi:hypothetical protein